MQMENAVPLLQYQHIEPAAAPQAAPPITTSVSQGSPRGGSLFGPAVVLEISPEGRAAYEASIGDGGKTSGVTGVEGPNECETCKNRRYVDVSDDPSVSFQTPTKLSPQEAMSAVVAHEGEHVRNEQAKAQNEGRKVVSQSVTISTSICPECGMVYVSGGQTKTVTASDEKQDDQNQYQDQEQGIDVYA